MKKINRMFGIGPGGRLLVLCGQVWKDSGRSFDEGYDYSSNAASNWVRQLEEELEFEAPYNE